MTKASYSISLRDSLYHALQREIWDLGTKNRILRASYDKEVTNGDRGLILDETKGRFLPQPSNNSAVRLFHQPPLKSDSGIVLLLRLGSLTLLYRHLLFLVL